MLTFIASNRTKNIVEQIKTRRPIYELIKVLKIEKVSMRIKMRVNGR